MRIVKAHLNKCMTTLTDLQMRLRRVYLVSVTLLTVAATAPAMSVQLSVSFGSSANAFTTEFVIIWNPRNLVDTPVYGAVSSAYWMGTYEVNLDMITKTNAAGGLGITTYDLMAYGGNGVNRLATGTSGYEATTFVNWLNTSSGHTPSYKFSGSTFALWTASDPGDDAGARHRLSDRIFEPFFRSKGASRDTGLGTPL